MARLVSRKFANSRRNVEYEMIVNLDKFYEFIDLPFVPKLLDYAFYVYRAGNCGGYRTSIGASEIHIPQIVLDKIQPCHLKDAISRVSVPPSDRNRHEAVLKTLVIDGGNAMVVCELPVWSGRIISGHIDLIELRREEPHIFIWDYKPRSRLKVEALPSYTQAWIYRQLLADTLRISSDMIGYGYFDEELEVTCRDVREVENGEKKTGA
jgi:hypothetical protein